MSDTRTVQVKLEPRKARPKLPTGAKLHEYVRASVPRNGNAPPPAFSHVRERMDALEGAMADEKATLHELMRASYEQGVPVNTLARWSGYTPRWVTTIVGPS